jgi:hypothetical protein
MQYIQSHCIEVAQGGVSSRAIHNHTQFYPIKNSKKKLKKFLKKIKLLKVFYATF